ncbi:MAG: rhodanese-like domain-containing protein [Proteobacteria bacterium]|nr:rhodanese-like domain-containing protein [Pseudomonadota bacterium]
MLFKKRMVVLSIAMLAFCFILSGDALAAWGGKELETEKIAVTFEKEVARGGYKVVSTEELKGWIDQKKEMLIVDTMPFEASYKKEHIPGAVNFVLPIPEMTQMDDKTKADFEKMLGPNKDRLIVFYCGFTKCTRSHNGAMWAVKLGYKNIYRQPGGIKAWSEADYPVEKVK